MGAYLQKARELIRRSRFLRFCITGGLNTAVDFGVYTLLTAKVGMGLYLAQVISYAAGMLNSYCINRSWTFSTKNRFFSHELGRFLGVNLLVMGLSVVLMYVLNRWLGWHYLIIKAMTVVVTMVLGFVLNRLLVFRGERG